MPERPRASHDERGERLEQGHGQRGPCLCHLRRDLVGALEVVVHHLLDDFTAKENVMMPLLIGSVTPKQAAELASEYLIKVGLYDRQNHRPAELSGGERQRVAIARALVTSPSLVLADEPTGNLDAANAKSVFKLFYDLVHAKGTTVLMVTHDEGLASQCDRVLHMQDGIIDA